MMKNADQIRPSSRRGASGAWRRGDRLKPAPADTLELYGLPSKGETRLNDFRNQEFYFHKILERYMRLCAINEKQLSSLFAAISLSPAQLQTDLKSLNLHTTTTTASTDDPRAAEAPFSSPSITELSTVLSALRKLREAITATGRKDAFARRAYFFGVHAGVLCKDWESYFPALTALLTTIHPATPLSVPDLKEYVGLLVLDQACRQGNIALAHETRLQYGYKDRRVELVLKALVADNWVVFWKMKKAVDGYQRSVMEFAEKDVRVHALKCLGRGYMSVDKKFVESSAQKGWKELVEEEKVGWELTETDRVLVKKPKGK
ncbi:hypothetical protein P280DRAFT_514415 [Massarina eburnea CBS 473.64]|uniref:CSN8/PSMD8/EIF3K domain-containing protein n=1 Tax=Massarina eburnea CBS 473.64 TaxID=1395130 RepID=A0A6A6SAZ1_9PLEO|nr:hypothetical protein P280DRAFT_514415 [Massarina eburnea CBS 473.64]